MASPAKITKRLRLSNCAIYLFEIFLLTEPFFVMDLTGDGKPDSWSIVYLTYTGISLGFLKLATILILIGVIPIVGFFFFSFDKTRNIKNIYGIITSAIAVFLITSMIPAEALGFGAVLALLFYLPIVFLSVMGMFARKNELLHSRNKR